MIVDKTDNLFKFFEANNVHSEDILDILRYDIFGNIYYYGDHFKLNSEGIKTQERRKILKIARQVLFYKSKLLFDRDSKNRVLSNAYFGFGNELNKLGYKTFTPPWQVSKTLPFIPNSQAFNYCNNIINDINSKEFSYLTSNAFVEKIFALSKILENFLEEEQIKTLVFPNDLGLFENLTLKIFKKLCKPSFIFLHGLPGRYNGVDDNRAEYLMVWGQKIKDLYIESGVNTEKIIVSGHPLYSGKKKPAQLRISLESILILTQSIPGKCDSTHIPVSDRSNLIYYLYSIKQVLQKFGVSQVRLRCHPGENINWYLKYIDRTFFIPETKNSINEALNKSTLIIGPTSTAILESVYSNVNYIVYEPIINEDKKENIINKILVPPFDKSDSRIPIAFCEEELKQLLLEKRMIDTSFIEDYIAPRFDISIIKDIVK